jgi:hypothetical protein
MKSDSPIVADKGMQAKGHGHHANTVEGAQRFSGGMNFGSGLDTETKMCCTTSAVPRS